VPSNDLQNDFGIGYSGYGFICLELMTFVDKLNKGKPSVFLQGSLPLLGAEEHDHLNDASTLQRLHH
jgi:hypothetical protein